jgi:hypothetical protein
MKRSRVVLTATLAALTTVVASEIPIVRPPAICGLKVTQAGTDVVLLRWQGGTPPFVVLRSDAADFTAARDVRVLAAGVAPREYRDRVGRGKRYWYQVIDRHSPPLLFRIEPDVLHEGELVTIHGAGFDANCKGNHLIVEGTMDAASLEHCTSSSVSFKVPLHAVSGEIEVMTDRGLGVFGSTLEDCDGIPRGAVTWSNEHAEHR